MLITSAVGNTDRLAARPLTCGGTPTARWLGWQPTFPALDLTACPALVVVAAHPDDETLGLGGMIVMLADAGVRVDVVSVTDGGAAYPGLSQLKQSRLKQIRRFESSRAAGVLGVAETICLDLPDGEISEYEAWLAHKLVTILGDYPPGVWCAANWRGDGHPDHEAVGRAALVAAKRSGAVLFEYPIWMWHWAIPADSAVPWRRARRVALATAAQDRKRRAVQSFRSQFRPPDAQHAAVLPPFVMRRLNAVGEVVFW